jgi:hypothetical protein
MTIKPQPHSISQGNTGILDHIYDFFREEYFTNGIDQDELDVFFTSISDFYLKYIDAGLEGLNIQGVKLKNKYTDKIFQYGISCITGGIDPLAVEISLSFLTMTIKNQFDISQQEFLEIKILVKLLIYMQRHNINDYLCDLNQFCSAQIFSEINLKFSAYKK